MKKIKVKNSNEQKRIDPEWVAKMLGAELVGYVGNIMPGTPLRIVRAIAEENRKLAIRKVDEKDIK